MFKLPLDAWVLSIPMAYAAVAFCTMVARIPAMDPESSSVQYYDDEQTSSKVAQRYNNQFSKLFESRIRDRRMNVFSNKFEDSPQ